MRQKIDNQPIHGKKIVTRQLNGLSLEEVEYPSGFRIKEHSHAFPLFYLVKKGSFTQFHSRKRLECVPMTLAFIPSHHAHSASVNASGANCFMIEFKGDWLDRLHTHSILAEAMDFKRCSSILTGIKLYREFQQHDRFSSLSIEGLTLELIAETSRNYAKLSGNNRPGWLSQVEEILQDSFSDQLTLVNIAHSVNVHPMHLVRAFHRHYHCTIGEYVRKLRIEYACRQITVTRDSLAEIAVKAGFYDQSHFSRSFKKVMGLTPSAYRANLRSY